MVELTDVELAARAFMWVTIGVGIVQMVYLWWTGKWL